MAWLAVDKDGRGHLFRTKPYRDGEQWKCHSTKEIPFPVLPVDLSAISMWLNITVDKLKWENEPIEIKEETKPEPKFKRGDFVFSSINSCAMKVINRCYDEHWRYQIFDDIIEYWFFEKELKKIEIGDVVYSEVWKEKVIVREFCDDKFILVVNFNGKLLKSLPSLIKQIKEETRRGFK